MHPSFREVKIKGFNFPSARFWSDQYSGIAQDAALATTPNTGVPAELLLYVDPTVIEILTAPRNARAIFQERQIGSFESLYFKFPVSENTGSTQAYTDYADGLTTGVNINWLNRAQYRYQTTIIYGSLELATTSRAKIDLANAKQQAAASIIDIASNKFALLGVEGMDIYGILNDPNLPNAEVVTSWENKTANQIFDDIIAHLFKNLSTHSGGHITRDTPLILAMSPTMVVKLSTNTAYNVMVSDMLKKYFSNINFVILPELEDLNAGEAIYMIAPKVNGQPTAELPFGVKMQAGPVIMDTSSFRQKFSASSYGGVVYRPFAFASITGMDAE